MRELQDAFGGRPEFRASDVPLEWMSANDTAWTEGSEVLREEISRCRPDVLHSNQFCFGRLSGEVPVVVTAHSDVLSWAAQTLPGGIAELERTAPAGWLQTYKELVGAGLRSASLVTAPTRWMAETAARLYPLEAIPMCVPNGLGDCLPHPAEGRELRAITAGRFWDRAKGLDILTELQPAMPVLLAGNAGAAEYDLPAACTLLGDVPHTELLRLFRASAVYLACSVYEPFGLAPLEAARAGCAIVARDIPSLQEVWGDAALYFKSAKSLAELLESLASDPGRLRAAQCRARARAERYTAQSMAEGYFQVYERALTEWQRARVPAEPAHA